MAGRNAKLVLEMILEFRVCLCMKTKIVFICALSPAAHVALGFHDSVKTCCCIFVGIAEGLSCDMGDVVDDSFLDRSVNR